MPIRPENKHRYPDNWKLIRKRILDRARHRCEWCGVRNHTLIHRNKDGSITEYFGTIADVAKDDGLKLTWVVLTIAHLNHTPEDCRPENLKALCQKCHLGYDMDRHVSNRARSRLRKLEEQGQINFLEECKNDTSRN